ncbi:hypothetical protein SCHPADRAFT_917631 [Schizopora paradoxa]|uniref:DNA damage-binding protein 1 n=1 Tax=Schizopora paradoxa TaxID=27342 RepID=A0A0H2R3M3_9AGAM|nr:hypothetical protein SCHPADRAFT_917631 [Schizopora paradoxa]
MKVVNTYHSPTSVSHSLKCCLTADPQLEHLVVVRCNELDVYAILADGLRLQCTLDVWGRVTSLKALGSSGSTEVKLLLTTDHPDPRLLLFQYVPGHSPHLECTETISLLEKNARAAEYFCTSIVDPTGDIAVVSSYVGKLKVLELSDGKCVSNSDAPIRELNLLSATFLRTASRRSSTLGFLYRNHEQAVVLTSHNLKVPEGDISSSPSSVLPETVVSDPTASILIAVPPHAEDSWNALGGVLVVGEETIYFYSNVKNAKKKGEGKGKSSKTIDPVAQIRWPYSQITAWAQVDEEGTRYLLGDSFGRLVLLALITENAENSKLGLLYLGEISAPTSLTVLPSQFIFVGSHFGDSQLIRIEQTRPSDGSHIQVIERFKNIAPIVDAVLVDSDNSGQNEIVTCSGGQNTGSLRIIRNGANFAVDAVVDGVPDVIAVWPLKAHSESDEEKFLLATTPVATYLYELPQNARAPNLSRLTEEDYPGFKFDERTLAASNVVRRSVRPGETKAHYEGSSNVVQVTSSEVVVIDMASRTREAHWLPPNGSSIVLADISPSQICVVMTEGKIVVLKLEDGKFEVTGKTNTREVSAVSFSRAKKTAPFASRLAVGYWDDFSVEIFEVGKTMPSVARFDRIAGVPRSLLLIDFEEGKAPSRRFLIIGQGDGRVVTIPYDKKPQDDSDRRIIALGDAPVLLSKMYAENRPIVLATGSRSALLSWKKDGILVSPLLLKDTLAAAPLQSKLYPSSLVLASLEGLTIGRVVDIAKLHIRTIPMGIDNPVRISYQAESNTFGIGRVSTDIRPAGVLSTSRSSFVVLDARSFALSHSIQLELDEEVTAVETVSLSSSDSLEAFYAVGTMYYDAKEREPTRGRILLFSVIGEKTLPVVHCVAKADTNGCVFSITSMKGKLVAAVNSGMVKLGEWNHNYIVTSIAVHDDKLITGDAVSSIAVLQLQDTKFKTLARDYGPLWPLCISTTDGDAIIGANSDNLFSFKLHQLPDKMMLDQDGEFRIDEIVNKFIPGISDIFTPKHVFFTSTGRIGVITESVDEAHSMNLTSLLRNLSHVVHGPGEMTYADRRSPVSAKGKSDGHPIQGFADGDFLERILDFDPSSKEMQKTLEGKTPAEKIELTQQQIKSILESLRSFH